MKRSRRRRDCAFSLIETLAALAIFGVAIAGIIQGITASLLAWRKAEEQGRALMLAENVMEEIQYNGDLTPRQENGQYEPPDDKFSWESEITEAAIPGLYQIDVRILWRSGGQDRQIALTTLKADRGQALTPLTPQTE